MTPNRPHLLFADQVRYDQRCYLASEADPIFERQEAEIAELVSFIEDLEGFAVGYGEIPDLIARRCRVILAKYSAASLVTSAAPPDTSNGGE